MKRVIISLIAVVLCGVARADEGMWLLPYLQKMNIGDMQAKGCKLSAEDIYSVNNSSLKDAIVIFGNGCTGEVVSAEGLLLTNHHCGYGSIQSLSTVERDFLKHGFWAMSNAEEIPAPGLEVRFVRAIEDVTDQVLGNVPSISKGEERKSMVDKSSAKVIKKFQAKHPNLEIVVKPFFGGNQYFAFAIEVFSDVRLVGTPPDEIGSFGGETDNWMWPRHTCDFSVFRIYANQDNQSAPYSSLNVPYKAKKHLKVSLDGYQEGDFSMILGFPGRTTRYMTSYEIDQMLEVSNPQRIFIRGERQSILKKEMAASDRVRIQYASKYAQSSNYWKNSIGKSRGLKRLDVKGKKRSQEDAFQLWAEQNTLPEEGFIDALPTIRRAVESLTPIEGVAQYLSEAIGTSIEILQPAALLTNVRLSNTRQQKSFNQNAEEHLEKFYKDFDLETDRKVAKQMMVVLRKNENVFPLFNNLIDKKFKGDTNAFVDDLYDRSIFGDKKQCLALLSGDSNIDINQDPAVVAARYFIDLMVKLRALALPTQQQLADAQRLYIAGLMRMQPTYPWASDANSTLRLTYGQVLPYNPADGILFRHFTTLDGVMEKDDPTNPDYKVSTRLKELHAAGDYGRYADADGKLRTAFLANCDITGGNSGSPTLNARGELIGLAFDGNWEAMSGDVAFEPQLQRTISVDIRFVLFIIDKFGGASWLVDEMDIVDSEPQKQ